MGGRSNVDDAWAIILTSNMWYLMTSTANLLLDTHMIP